MEVSAPAKIADLMQLLKLAEAKLSCASPDDYCYRLGTQPEALGPSVDLTSGNSYFNYAKCEKLAKQIAQLMGTDWRFKAYAVTTVAGKVVYQLDCTSVTSIATTVCWVLHGQGEVAFVPIMLYEMSKGDRFVTLKRNDFYIPAKQTYAGIEEWA